MVRVDAFEVGEYDLAVERVAMLGLRVVDDRISDGVLVVANEVASTARARLLVCAAVHRT